MKSVSELLRHEARLNNISRRIFTALSTIVLPTLIALVSAFNNSIPGILLFSILITLAIFQLVFAIITLAGSQTVQAAHFEIEDIKKKHEDSVNEASALLIQVNRLNYLQAAIRGWGEIGAQARERKVKNYDDLKKDISNILAPICDKPGELFGCEGDEWWNIAVYLYDDEARILFSVWRQKHRAHPSQEALGRPWRPGEGHIGKAFADRASKITKDAHDPDVSELMAPPRTDLRDYDEIAYRSYASVPFFDPLSQSPDPWGVIVATSNYQERFDKFNTLILQHAAIAVAELVAVLDTPIGDIRKLLLPSVDPKLPTGVVGDVAPESEAENGSA